MANKIIITSILLKEKVNGTRNTTLNTKVECEVDETCELKQAEFLNDLKDFVKDEKYWNSAE